MHQPLIPAHDVDDFIVIRARAFAKKVQRSMLRDVLAGEDLPVLEWQLLFSIARFGSCHLAYITGKTSIDPAHGSRAAAAMEAKGLIIRQEDPDNRRRKLISLTDDGLALFNRIWPRARAQMRLVTDQLSETDFREFKRLLSIIDTSASALELGSPKKAPETGVEEDDRIAV